jgi:membrane protein
MTQVRRFDRIIDWRRPIFLLASTGLLFRKAASEWIKDNALRLSAAVSFYAVLSLAPLLVIVVRVMGIAHAQFSPEQIIKQTTFLVGAQAANAIKPIIDSSANQSSGHFATIISTVVLLFSATSVFVELKSSMNSIWDVEFTEHKAKRAHHVILTFIRTRLLSLAMVFCLGFLLVLFIFISGTLTAFQQRIGKVDRWPIYLGGGAVSWLVEIALFSVIFKLLPDLRLGWRNVWHGALIAAILFSAGRFGLSIFFKYARINNMYGAAGSLIAVLTWIYYSCFSLFFGAEFTKVWTRQYDSRHASSRHHAAR